MMPRTPVKVCKICGNRTVWADYVAFVGFLCPACYNQHVIDHLKMVEEYYRNPIGGLTDEERAELSRINYEPDDLEPEMGRSGRYETLER